MNKLTQNQITNLLESMSEADMVVSLYMPMETVGRETRGNSIRLKNRLTAAREQLETAGMDHREIDTLLEEAMRFEQDREFLEHQSEGLVVFVTREQTKYLKVPISFEPLTVVGPRPHIKPLLDYFANDSQYFVLALSQNQVRLFRGSRYHIEPIEVEEMPQGLEEALRYDDPEARLQLHTTPQTSTGGRGAALYHGHGDVETDDKTRLLRYFQIVDKALQSVLAEETAPMVIAAVDYLVPIFREASSYNTILDDHIGGNPDNLSPQELHEKALDILEPLFRQKRQETWDSLAAVQGDEQVVSNIIDVVQVAFQGRVETLFMTAGSPRWGQVNQSTGEVTLEDEPSPKNIDVLDFAAVQTLKHGGDVFVVTEDDEEKSLSEPATAVLRF
ncbi:MAG: hypothetical protein KDE51_09130 [Anaerolineales bacterium]|nr:hypothetical protein [Anaerolineales bacterium]